VDYLTDYVPHHDELDGIEDYRRFSDRRVAAGEAFFDAPTAIDDKGIPRLSGASGPRCWPRQEPPLEVRNSAAHKSVFVTGCEVEGGSIVIRYYEYVFD
jgi:hypothetical protein